MAHQALDPREYDRVLRIIERYKIADHPRIAMLLRQINPESPAAIDAQLWQQLQRQAAVFEAFHKKYPFLVVPRGTFSGMIDTGLRQKADNQPVLLTEDEVWRSGLLPAPTGEGKTTLLHHIITGVRRAGHHVILIDPKPSYPSFLDDDDWFVLTPEMRINLIAPTRGLTTTEHVALLVDIGAETLYAAEDYKQITTSAYTSAFAKHEQPTMHDVRREIQALNTRGETWKFRDAQRGADLRHERLILRWPGLHTSGAPGLDALFNHSLYIPLATVTETEHFLLAYLLRRLYHA